MEKKCKSESLLHLYIDEELSKDEKRELDRHLENCDSCRNELQELLQTNSLLVGMAEVEPSDGFSRAFWEKVDAHEEKNKQGFITSFFEILWRPRFAAAAMLVLIIAGVVIFQNDIGKVANEEMILAVDLEMLVEFELVDNLDILENLDDLMDGTENG